MLSALGNGVWEHFVLAQRCLFVSVCLEVRLHAWNGSRDSFENAAKSASDNFMVFAVQIWPRGSNGMIWVCRIELLSLILYIHFVLTRGPKDIIVERESVVRSSHLHDTCYWVRVHYYGN